jgi:hypothetical protein
MPAPGKQPVEWGFQWIATNFILFVAFGGFSIYNIFECFDGR